MGGYVPTQLNQQRGCGCPDCSMLRERLPKTAPAVATRYGTEELIKALRDADAALAKLADGTPVAFSRIGMIRIKMRETVADQRILVPMAADLIAEIKQLREKR